MDERRRRLLELGAELFTRHAYDELSMAKIAREAGITKALLYHYFPSKEAYFLATLEEKADELPQRTEPDPDLPPLEQLRARSTPTSVDRGERGQLRQDDPLRGRAPRCGRCWIACGPRPPARILDGLRGDKPPSPMLRTAVRGWLGFMDGACLDWVKHRDVDRETLHGLLLAR